MRDHDIGAVPVLGSSGSVVGMLTDRDICLAALTRAVTIHRILVVGVMTTHVVSCSANDSLQLAQQLMSDSQVRRIPVVDRDDRPLGLLSVTDIARYVASRRDPLGFDRAVTRTLSSIGRPRSPMGRRARPWL